LPSDDRSHWPPASNLGVVPVASVIPWVMGGVVLGALAVANPAAAGAAIVASVTRAPVLVRTE
jgi:hypothetical protein